MNRIDDKSYPACLQAYYQHTEGLLTEKGTGILFGNSSPRYAVLKEDTLACYRTQQDYFHNLPPLTMLPLASCEINASHGGNSNSDYEFALEIKTSENKKHTFLTNDQIELAYWQGALVAGRSVCRRKDPSQYRESVSLVKYEIGERYYVWDLVKGINLILNKPINIVRSYQLKKGKFSVVHS